MKRWLLALVFLAFATTASAQNPTCPTRPVGDSTNACASTAFVNNTIVEISALFYNDLADAEAAIIPAVAISVYTKGYYSAGDGGGAQYIRVVSEPTWATGKFRSQDRFLPDGSTSPSDGGWWALANTQQINYLSLGAIGDGSAANETVNSTASASFTAIATANGRGELFVPAGSYYIGNASPGSAILLVSNTAVRGAGTGATQFVVADNSNLAGVINMSGVVNVGIYNLSINGNRANQVSGHCIRAGDHGADNLRIENVNVRECFSYGLGIQGSYGGAAGNTNVFIDNVFIQNTGSDGIDIKNHLGLNKGIQISNVRVDNPGASRVPAGGANLCGIDLRGPVKVVNVTITGLTHVNGNTVCGVRIRQDNATEPTHLGGKYSSVEGFYIESTTTGAGVFGLEVTGSDVTFANGTIKGVSRGTQILGENISVTNVHVIDPVVYGFFAGNSGIYFANNFICTACRTFNTTLSASTIGFYLDGIANATIVDSTAQNHLVGISISATATGTRVINPRYLTNTTAFSDAAANGQTSQTWDTVTANGATVVAAATLVLDKTTGDVVDVSGSTGITAITLAEGRTRILRFTGTPTITNGASLVLPGGANITAAAGDYAVVRGYAAGVVRAVVYSRIDGSPVIFPSGTGLLARTGATSWTYRTATGTANEITFTNGDGVSGNPTASLPSALTFTGKTVTDGTFSGATLSTKLINGAYLIEQEGDRQTTITGTTAETFFYVITVPAGVMGVQGGVEVEFLWSNNNSVNNKTIRVYFGASGAGTGGTLIGAETNSTNTARQSHYRVSNRNATNSQIMMNQGTQGGWGPSSGPFTTAVDTTAATEIYITGQLVDAADTMSFESVTAKVWARN